MQSWGWAMLQVTKRSADQAPMTTILVVEDEALIRMASAEGLREYGFRVLEAASAPEAIMMLKADPAIDIIFSDVHMPGDMDGIGLAHWVREHAPDMKIVLTSGTARSADLAGSLVDLGPIVAKPYRLSTIVDQIRTLTSHIGQISIEHSGQAYTFATASVSRCDDDQDEAVAHASAPGRRLRGSTPASRHL